MYAMVRAPTPYEEDRRRICRERKTLTAERVEHVNRIKGLLFAQGISDYEPLLRKRRARLEELRTGDGRPLPKQLKAQIGRELDRLELTLEQIKSVETERDAMLTRQRLKRGVFRSVIDLQVAINRFVAETNLNPKPFVASVPSSSAAAALFR